MLVELTRSQVMALGDILVNELHRPGHTERYLDASTGTETTIEDLLRVFVNMGCGLHTWPEEGDRQLLLLALALCSVARPGFDYALRNLAAQVRGGPGPDGVELFENFKRLNTHPIPLFVGTVVQVAKASGVNAAGALAVVVEEYRLQAREGWFLLFEDGRHDGFSPDDCGVFGVTPVLVDTSIADYVFESSPRLVADFQAGRFASTFRTARAFLAQTNPR